MSDFGDDGGGGGNDGGGTDNLAFAIGDECVDNHVTSSTHDVGHGNQHVTLEKDHWSPSDTIDAPKENGGHHRSFVSQHYVEPVRNSPEPCYKSETKIDVPCGQAPEKNSTTELKLNGVHGNGNNNDASFLNSSATSVQVNDNSKKEQIEAVNLELVSMRPYTGNNIQTKGQEACEVPADPYEEYFVPVNEHRKYIRGPEAEVETTVAGVRFDLGPGVGREGLSLRDPAAGLVDYSHWLTALRGEKLYVTKDKRSRSSYWRRILCWGCGLSILAIVIIIAILAATGVILTQEATEPLDTINERNSQYDVARTAGSQEFVKDPPLSPPPETSSFPAWPTTDETLYQIVPDALDGVLKLDNLVWNEEMADVKSRVYRDVAFEIEQHLQNMLRTDKKDPVVINVYDITKDSEVKFRISHPASSIPEEVQENIEKAIRDNGNLVGRYHLGRLQVGTLVDECLHGNMDCSESCKFHYSQGLFICSCESGRTLDKNGKDCLDDNDLSNVEMDDTVHTSSTEATKDFVQGRSRGPDILYESAHPDSGDHSDFVTNSMSTPPSSMESKSDSEPTVRPTERNEEVTNKNMNNDPEISRSHMSGSSDWVFSHVGHSMHEEHSIAPTDEPELSAEPVSSEKPRFFEEELSIEPEENHTVETEAPVELESKVTVETYPSSESESSVEPELNPTALPEPSAEPESSVEPELNPVALPEPTAEPESFTESDKSLGSETSVEPQSTPEPETSAEPQPSITLESEIHRESSVTSESKAFVEPEPSTEPPSQPEPSAKPEQKLSMIPDRSMEEDILIKVKDDSVKERMTEMPLVNTNMPSMELNKSIEVDTSSEMTMNSKDDVESTMPMIESSSPMISTEMKVTTKSSIESDLPMTTIIPQEYPQSSSEIEHMTISEIFTETTPESEPKISMVATLKPEPSFDSESRNLRNNINENTDEINNDEPQPVIPLTTNNEKQTTEVQSEQPTTILPERGIEKDEPSVTTESVTTSPVTMIAIDSGKESDETTLSIKHSEDAFTEKENEITELPVNDGIEMPHTTLASMHFEETTLNVEIEPMMTLKSESETTFPELFNPETSSEMTKPVLETNTEPTQNIKSEEIEYMSNLTNKLEDSSINHTIKALDISRSNVQDINESNVIEHAPKSIFSSLPKEFGQNVEPLIESLNNETNEEHIMPIPREIASKDEQDTHAIIPQLIPEQIAHFTTKPEESTTHREIALEPNDQSEMKKNMTVDTIILDRTTEHPDENAVSVSETLEHSTNHPLHPAIFPENAGIHFVEKTDHHVEDMSPFLPDVHREKETSKKAPRLDKDEQDVPNPFEPHVEDVIVNKPEQKEHPTNTSEEMSNDFNNYNTTMKLDTKDDVLIIPKEIKETGIENSVQQNELLRESEDERLKQSLNSTQTFATNELSDGITMNDTSDVNNEKVKSDEEIFSVVPLDDQKETKETEYEMSDKVETTTEAAQITTAFIEQKDESLDESIIDNANSSEKQEENTVEDQYNDINDDTLPKTFDHTNSIKIIKEIQDDGPPIVTNLETQEEKLKSMSTLKEIQSTTEKMPSTETEMSPSSMTSVAPDKHMDDAKLTTQVPVLPIEIEHELSTTEPADKLDPTTIANFLSDNQTENSSFASSDAEKEPITMIPSTMAPMYSLETKTTAQVPILPEELQTTEHEPLVTTSSMRPEIMKEMNDTNIFNETKVDEMTPTTIAMENINNIFITTMSSDISSEIDITADNATRFATEINDDTTGTNLTETISESNKSMEGINLAEIMSTESNKSMDDIQNIVLSEKSNNANVTTSESTTNYPKIETTFAVSNEDYTAMATEMNVAKESDSVTVSEDIRPVTEEVLDDMRPLNFGFRSLFPVTTPKDIFASAESEELSEEELKVIPLEKSQEIKKKSMEKKSPDKYKYKKEKELSLENERTDSLSAENYEPVTLTTTEVPKSLVESNDTTENINMSSTSTESIVPKFILTDTEGNVAAISKLKIFEITAPLNKSESNTSLTNTMTNNTETEGTNKYPNYIPVSEEIVESPPVTEPFILLRNFTLHRTISPIAFGVEQATTPSNILNDTLANSTETILQTNIKETKNLTVDHFGPLPSSIMSFSKCSAGQFQCTNGTSRDGAYCVSLSSKCDSERDCSDGSDELNCEAEGCPGNFQCANRQCLKRHLVCNGIVDCDDGSDEKDCQNWQCIFDEYRCTSGRCIPMLWRCNDRSDCEDHHDEYNCAESCGNDKYLCPTEKRCIPQTWRCNGIPECSNGEDEKLCDCSVSQFRCNTGGCVPQEEVCDGIPHCPDYSDEWDCLSSFSFIERNRTEPDERENEESNWTIELNDRVSLLKIRQSDGDYRLICSDGWDKEFSDSYCRSLGFASSETTDFKTWNKSHKILRLKSNPNRRASLVTNLQRVDFCVSEKVVEVSCQEFSSHCAEGPTARLVGGTPVSVEQWPSVALLKEDDHGVACTASVLGPLHVVASYSCVNRYRQNGQWKLFTGGNMFKAHLVKTIIPYPQAKYNKFFYNNDIALVEVEEPLIFSRNVSATCLPTHPIQPRQICVTAGWRFPVNGEVDLQKYLEFLPVPTYDSEKCNATGHYAGFITKDDICVNFTDTDKGPCYNDEGAPLMCVSESGKWEIQGLLSHHSRCSRRHPAIYSSLEPALFWLRHSVPALQAQS